MSKDKPTRGGRPKKNTEVSLVRSSAAEYLTFVAAGGNSEASVEMRYEDESIWLTQKMMATRYDVSVPAINQHLKRLFSDNELELGATVKKYLIVQTEGSRQVQRSVEHYSLQAIIAVGFKIENERSVQFRKWANQIVKDYTIQGWTMDSERLKQGGTLTDSFLSANWRRFGKSGFPSASSTRKSPIFTPPRWITIRPQRRRATRTVRCYCRWVALYATFAGTEREMMRDETASRFLQAIIQDNARAYTTQKQALNAVLFYFRHVCGLDDPVLELLPKRPKAVKSPRKS